MSNLFWSIVLTLGLTLLLPGDWLVMIFGHRVKRKRGRKRGHRR